MQNVDRPGIDALIGGGLGLGLGLDGPVRLCRALAISRAEDGTSLLADIRLEPGTPPRRIARTARVGVAYAGAHASRILRFYDATNAHVSRPSPRTIGLGASAPAQTRTAQ